MPIRRSILVLHVFGCILMIFSSTYGEDEKRIVVHSDDDLLQLVQTLSAKVQNLEKTVTVMSQQVASVQNTKGVSGSSIYIRWGALTCPANGTTALYTGFTAGSGYNDNGGGANQLCLPPDPQWDHYEDGVASGARVFGTEYDVGWRHPGSEPNFFGKNIRNEDVPCTVCNSPRPTMIMLPARRECYPGWTKEYSGYLMSGHDGHPSPSEFICVDKIVDVEVGGHDDQNGNLLYLVEGLCGSLKCPPYVNGRELTCVVCTK